jgi:aminocarboxymuconate-semialdehyde decarboxylase
LSTTFGTVIEHEGNDLAKFELPPSLRPTRNHVDSEFVTTDNNAWKHRNIVRQDCVRPPSEHVRRRLTDTAAFDHRALDANVSVMTEDHVMLGSGHPYRLREQQIGLLAHTSPTLDATARERMHWRDVQAFCGLAAEARVRRS